MACSYSRPILSTCSLRGGHTGLSVHNQLPLASRAWLGAVVMSCPTAHVICVHHHCLLPVVSGRAVFPGNSGFPSAKGGKQSRTHLQPGRWKASIWAEQRLLWNADMSVY